MPTKELSTYLFLGEEGFLKEEAIEKLRSRFLGKGAKDLNYSVFYAKDKKNTIKEMLDALNTAPILSERRLIVLKDADNLPLAEKESVISYLHNQKKTSLFIIESPTPAIKGKFLLEASKYTELVYYRPLTDSGLTTWISRRVSLSGKKISSDAVNAIKESLPNDLRVLSSNIENIILYIGKKTFVAKQDIEDAIGKSPSHTAFDLIDSIERKDVKKALKVFSTLKKDKRKEIELLGLLSWNARMFLRVKELLRVKNKMDIRRDLALSPRKFDQIVRYSSRFEKRQLLTLLNEILKSDLDIKRSSPAPVIERLIVKMCS